MECKTPNSLTDCKVARSAASVSAQKYKMCLSSELKRSSQVIIFTGLYKGTSGY